MSTFLSSNEAAQLWQAERSPLPFDAWALTKGIIVLPDIPAPGPPPVPPLPGARQPQRTRLSEIENPPGLAAPPAPEPPIWRLPEAYADPSAQEIPPETLYGNRLPSLLGGPTEFNLSPQDMEAILNRPATPTMMGMLGRDTLFGAPPPPAPDSASSRFDDPAYGEAILKSLRGDQTAGGDFFITNDGQVITGQQLMEATQGGGAVGTVGGTTSNGRVTSAGGTPSWAPPQMPHPVRPDYSQVDEEFAKLEPQPQPEDESDEIRQDSMLMGLAQGLMSPARDVGDLILNMAGGALGGWAQGRQQNREDKRLFEERLAEYRFKKLGLLETRAGQDADFANKVLEVDYTNALNLWKANWARVERARSGGPKTDTVEIDGKTYLRTKTNQGTSYKPFNSIAGVRESVSVLSGLGDHNDARMALETYGFTAGSPEELAVVSLAGVTPQALQFQVMTDDEYNQFVQKVNTDYQMQYGEIADGFGGVPGSVEQKRGDYQSVFDKNLIQFFVQSEPFRNQVFDYLARSGGYTFQ